MRKIGTIATVALMGALLGSGYQPTAEGGGYTLIGSAHPRRRTRGNGGNLHYTKKGPGRRPAPMVAQDKHGNWRRVGRKRLRAATGPDSINARDVFYRLLDNRQLKEARSYLASMARATVHSDRNITTMLRALDQHEEAARAA